jgi:hypothetical protein
MSTAPQAESNAAAGQPKARLKPAGKRRHRSNIPTRFLTLASLDGRTKASRRAFAMIEQFTEQLGTAPTAIQKLNMMHAATLGILMEDMETRALQGETIDPAVFATLLNAQRRTLKAL